MIQILWLARTYLLQKYNKLNYHALVADKIYIKKEHLEIDFDLENLDKVLNYLCTS